MELVQAYDPHGDLRAKVVELDRRMIRLEDAFYRHQHEDDDGEPENDRELDREAEE